MLSADGGDHGSLTADDLGVILWIHSDGQLEAPESLNTQHTNNKLKLNIKVP